MSKFKLAFGIHNHQPVGNFEFVFEDAHKKAYEPFLELVRQHESFRFSLHQSGILWRWQERTHSDYFRLVGELVDAGRVELMTGGFYEPILTSIPERDARGQIARLTKYVEDHFEQTPQGLWLTERIWEPHLPKLLAQSGVGYLPIDDTHFLYAGLELDQLTGPFITEEAGHAVTLLPIQKRLRYLIPFGKVEEVIAELRRQAERNAEGLAVYADDGEKFGVWPQTHEHCYDDHWLADLFEAFERNSDWLEVITLGEAAQQKPVGRVYLPTASYAEMLHWALPPSAFLEYERFEKWLKEQEVKDRWGRFVRGGHWRGFLAKYDESNLMHKKMLGVSERLARLEEEHPKKAAEALSARDRLYAAQCNCPYWHGVFGGLYLPHIRQAIYAALIEAESALDRIEAGGKPRGVQIESRDYDYDGGQEIVISTGALGAVIKPGRGGTLLELSLKKHAFSPTDTLTRRKEGYHLRLAEAVAPGEKSQTASIHDLVVAKEKDLDKFLIEDWYLKRCFIDHFFTGDVDFERFKSGKYGEEGDFILEPFGADIDRSENRITLTRHGNLWRPEGPVPLQMIKRYEFDPNADGFSVDYEMMCPVDGEVHLTFASESNLNFQAGHAEDRFVMIDGNRIKGGYLDAEGIHGSKRGWALVDQFRGVEIGLDSRVLGEIWQLPIFTVSLSEAGFERVYQGTTLVNVYRVVLGQGRKFDLRFDMYAGTVRRGASFRGATSVAH